MFLLPPGAEAYANISDKFPLSADHLGRDLLSRTIHGARISLSVAIVAATVSLVVGTVYGSISGYMGGNVDGVMMRIVDFLYGFPFLIVVILLQSYFKALARQSVEGGIERCQEKKCPSQHDELRKGGMGRVHKLRQKRHKKTDAFRIQGSYHKGIFQE